MITEKDHWRVHAIVPAIPFEVPKQKKVPKGGTIKIDVKVDPEQTDSETFEVEIKLFGSGTPEEWLEFLYVWDKVKNGQKLSTDTAKAAVFANMLRGEALRVFEIRRKQHTLDDTSNNFDTVVQEVTKYFFPEQALIDQKRFLRHYNCKKPSMMVREYVARLQDINQKLNQFPPFAANQAMSDNKLIEILEYSMPHVWNVEMRAHGFVPHTKTLSEVVEFYERTEILEKVRGVNLHQGQGNSKQKVANLGSKKVQTDSD